MKRWLRRLWRRLTAAPPSDLAPAPVVAAFLAGDSVRKAAYFHRIRPALLAARPLWADVSLAVLHGLPLAVVAYNVAALLLHGERAHPALSAPVLTLAREAPYPAPVAMPAPDAGDARADSINATLPNAALVCPNCGTSLDPARWRAARRWGRCAACKPQ